MDEWESIPLSRLSQAGFCLRRTALITNEQLWNENADTAKGRSEHEKVHTQRVERRGDSVKFFEYAVSSEALGVFGYCDCIEAQRDDTGCSIPGVDFPVRLYPVEFKHGKVREEEEYEIQLCAQAMCLEEMFQTSIPKGAIFYISSHRRCEIVFTKALRQKVVETVKKVDSIRKSFSIPPAQYTEKCRKCSLYDLCMPKVSGCAQKYCAQLRMQAKEDFDL